VLEAGLNEARRRSRERIELPAEERVTLRWVSGEPWPAFHSYLGDFESEILVNEDFPLTLRSVVDVVTHEGYPGHHVAAVLLDAHLVRAKGWKEFSVAPERTPQEFVLESLANYGSELAFPAAERRRFERDVLAPLAGLEDSELETYLDAEELVSRLAPFATEGARRYLDGELDRVGVALWLERNALVVDQWAFLRFVDRYRTLVATYSFGRDLARDRFGRHDGDPWVELAGFFKRPTLPKDLLDAT
jgi:hypothetical protein